MLKRLTRIFLVLLAIVVVGLIGTGIYVYRIATASLAQLDGTVSLQGLPGEVIIDRDATGIPTIKAADKDSRAFALGFLHAQDRFFQMDLMRRVAAGELSELVGEAALPVDRHHRIHQFRKRATNVINNASEEDKRIIDYYAAGVNSGLRNLGAKPVEYFALGTEPRTWVPEDTVLCLYAMFLDLQESDYKAERDRHTAYASLPKPLADFLCPKGSRDWDAPIDGGLLEDPALPGPDVIDLRNPNTKWPSIPDPTTSEMFGTVELGSNNWAVDGKHTKHGGAIVADDMHLGLRVPNIWYRAAFVVTSKETGEKEDYVATGVTLPGTAAMVVGSNGKIAWGFTNTEGDWSDLVLVDVDPADAKKYQTPEGTKEIEKVEEKIAVRGREDDVLTIEQTIWGPIVARDPSGKPMALRWVAHDTDGTNLLSARMIFERDMEKSLLFAAECGNPAQNFTVADSNGRIAWTVMGRIPKRSFDGWMPASWADGKNKWEGYLPPSEYPKVVDPESGRIWTANARVVSGDMLAKMGFGPYDMGARQKQIRDDLLAIEKADEKDMLKIQLDDRAVFWERWQTVLMKVLDDKAVQNSPKRKEAREFIDKWGGRASVDSVGFRLVRQAHLEISRRILEWLTGPCRQADPNFRISRLPRSIEGSIWRMVDEKPMHLLDPKYQSWDEVILQSIDAVVEEATKSGSKSLVSHTWGEYNTLRINHPLSASLRPILGESFVDSMDLDMPHVPVSGGSRNMPKIIRPASGASERLGVSPGRESEGYFHMPAGQSGHPFSPYYRVGHQDWVEGNPSPFLAGTTVHTLRLVPGKQD